MPKHHDLHAIAPQRLVDAVFGAFSSMRVPDERIDVETLASGTSRSYPKAVAYFHHVDGASCRLHVRGQSSQDLQPGDLVFLPHGAAHRIECLGGARSCAELTSGVFRFSSPYGSAVVAMLPQVQRLPAQSDGSAATGDASRWLAATIGAIRSESCEPSLGSALMQSHLVDLLFVWALRRWLADSQPLTEGWIAPLQDPAVSRALALLHADPARAWSVAALARQLNQSRSAFSQRFVALVGEPPIRYLARWRMRLAAELLVSSPLRVGQIAQRVGYASEPAFSRTFKRHFHKTPVSYRRSGAA